MVFPKGHEIENVWTFKNTGLITIPEGTKLVRVSGSEELNMSDMVVLEDVKSNEFFKLKIKTVAP